jgi:hypothetical protein
MYEPDSATLFKDPKPSAERILQLAQRVLGGDILLAEVPTQLRMVAEANRRLARFSRSELSDWQHVAVAVVAAASE